jgi:serine protease Do
MRKTLFSQLFLVLGMIIFSQYSMARALPDFTPLVEKNSAAVVNISTSLKKNIPENPNLNIPDVPEDSPFYDFFNKYFGQTPKDSQPYGQRSSLGSGFIISNDGYVITNNHVVENAQEIIVGLKDRRELVAELIGTDKRSDIALLKIKGKDFPTLELGESEGLQVGEWVLAIGSPFGFNHSVTAGIISAMERSLPNENYVPFIQTDVAINPGNSGGPLFNLKGEVIGVNSQIYSRTGGFMGLSFAVPIDVVVNVYQQLKQQGYVSRGWLGVLIQDVTRELAESFGMERPHGALIAKVLPGGPAESSGFEAGDVVVKFNNKEISFSSDLPPVVGNSKIGSTVPVEVIRRGKNKRLQVEIEKLPEDGQVKLAANDDNTPKPANRLNVTAKTLTDEQKEQLDLSEHGIFIEEVNDGIAKAAGIRAGDVLLLLNNIKIKDAQHFSKVLKELPDKKSIPVLIQRRGTPIFLALKMTDNS